MWLRPYGGGAWVEASERHPDSLTILAPQYLQEQCVGTGGRNWKGQPNFRLAVAETRFALHGGQEITFCDLSGNYQRCVPDVIFTPRYSIPKELHPCYVLERWRPPEWYAAQGWGGRDQFTWEGIRSLQQKEPIWPEGGYEAVLRSGDMEDYALFPMSVSTWTVYKAIRLIRIAECVAKAVKLFLVDSARQKAKEQERENRREMIRDWIGPFGFATHDAGRIRL